MIGVFDSGVGGLSVLRALRARLPGEQFVYIADAAHAPYGERDEAFVAARAMELTRRLVEEHRAELVVVACNTATAAAVHLLRDMYPELPIVGIEPALKPAAQSTRNGRVGVMATRGTLASAKFAALQSMLEGQGVRFVLQACDGLALAIERGDAVQVRSLCECYVGAIRRADIDTLVLGCTHYPFAEDVLREFAGPAVAIMEPGVPVARRVADLLGLRPSSQTGSVRYVSTGHVEPLEEFARRWL